MMFYVLIVEDEKIERETLMHILERNIDEIDQVLCAKNAIEALLLFQEYQPQIVCADINLPGMNGLDMIKEMKNIKKDTYYLILSSYNYFEYAQEAIRLGVSDFILKPYNIPDFLASIKNLIDHIHHSFHQKEEDTSQIMDKITPMLERECLYAIVSNESDIEIYRRVRLLDKQLQSGFCIVVREERYNTTIIDQLLQPLKEKQFYCIYEQLHGSIVCFAFSKQHLHKQDIKEIAACLQQQDTSLTAIGIGPIVNDVAKLNHSFLMARENIGRNTSIYEQLNALQNAKLKETIDIPGIGNIFMECLEKSYEDGFKVEIRRLCETLMVKDGNEIQNSLQQLYTYVMEHIQKAYPHIELHDIQLLPFHITANIYHDLPMNLNLNMKKLHHIVEEERFKNTSYLVKEAMHYIEQNYQKQIVLDDLARFLKVSPFHISRLLSASLHKTFTELVAEKRVEASKELLKTDERIKEIASEVGFQGQSYYNKIFKKYTGMTPKVYRNKIKQ